MKKKKRQIDWDKVQRKMVKYITDILQKKWKTPVILDIYELDIKDIDTKSGDYGGFVGFFVENNEVYIDFVGVQKLRSKEHKTYIIAHELCHILDFIELFPSETKFHTINDNSALNTRNKRVLYEREKRAYSKGFDLLKKVGVPDYYLECFIKYRSAHLAIMVKNFRKKQKLTK